MTTSLDGLAISGSSPRGEIARDPDEYHGDQNAENRLASLQTVDGSNVHYRTQSNVVNGAPVTRSTTPQAELAGVFCPPCTERKAEPGGNGRTRKNAKHKCKNCLELKNNRKAAHERESGHSPAPKPGVSPVAKQTQHKKGSSSRSKDQVARSQAQLETLRALWSRSKTGEAAGSNSSKPWRVATAARPAQEESDDQMDYETEEDDPANRPRPIPRNDPQWTFLGERRDSRPVITRIQDNCRQWHPESQLRRGAPSADFFDGQGRGVQFNAAGSSGTNSAPPAIACKHPGPLMVGPGQASIAPDVTRKGLSLHGNTGDRPQPYQDPSRALLSAFPALKYMYQVQEAEKSQELFNKAFSNSQQSTSIKCMDSPFDVTSSMDYTLHPKAGPAQQPWSMNPAFKEHNGRMLEPADDYKLSSEDTEMIAMFMNFPPDPEPEPASPSATGPPPAIDT